MQTPINIRAAHGFVTPIVLVTLIGIALAKSHVYRVYGGYVDRVDHTQFATGVERLVITDVSVLSPDGESMLNKRTVVIDNGEILSISRDEMAPEGARVIDGHGRFLAPGLIDSHVHLRKQPNDLLLYVANGITHVRDLAGSKGDLSLREEAENGRISPRIYVASPLLFSAGPIRGWANSFIGPRKNVHSAKRAPKVVQSLVDQGYDALKTYANIDMESYRAVNAAAAKLGIPTVGHLPFDATLDELPITQQREIAHIEEIIKPLQKEYAALGRSDYAENFPNFVSERADEIIDDLLANDITVNSTLWLSEVIGEQAFGLEDALRRLPLEYANPAMVEGSPYVKTVGWLPGHNEFEQPADTSPEKRERIERNWAARAEAHRVLFRKMVERKVRIIAGTDATSHLTIAGFSLHDELESLTRNGMTPAQAIRAATRTPSHVMKTNAGTIEVGRRADLVLLSANPLEDIHNTTTIDAVVLGGRWLDRARLDAILTAVKTAHAASRNFDLSDYR